MSAIGIALCLAIGGGPVVASQPADAFVLSWKHSVEHVEWRERYAVSPDGLRLTQAAVQGSGAGMEPPDGAVFRDGWWIYEPELPPIERLLLSHSEFVADYTLCANGQCQPLTDLLDAGGKRRPVGPERPVELSACPVGG